ncbi:hypothetical protein GCM10028803_05200 [Larkinella knui]|uniref:Uncharacterized protein n=1 Tax=Larkinella knui TaxID=2025310 RepID=A0A3P1CKE1_9BACT|nr:hypothetical protein [Larkinella knui]RRB13802.1 hypothetical protein EHT87_16215 [Larkinella knui]
MNFKTLLILGGLEFAFLVAILLNALAFIDVSWFWLFAPLWFPVLAILLLVFHLFFYLATVAVIRVFVNRLKSYSNQ